jgi:hypothetical protein
MTPMMDEQAAMDASKDEGCSNCTNIDEMLKRFDARECVQLKKKFEDERKKVKWLVFFMIISWIFFGLYVKN